MQDGAVVGRVAFGLTLLAVLYSVGLLAAVVAVPAVDGETLLEHGGSWSLAIFAQPLPAALLLFIAALVTPRGPLAGP